MCICTPSSLLKAKWCFRENCLPEDTQKSTPKTLQVGKTYIHHNGHFYRTIIFADAKFIEYLDDVGLHGACTRNQFYKMCRHECPPEAKAETDKRNKEWGYTV